MRAHTFTHNQLVCVHMWVHAHIPTGQEDGLMCLSSLSESWSQEDARTPPGELVRGHQCRESDKHHGKVLTWASRVITGLGCAACGKRGENTRERWEKCNLLPWHQATPQGSWPPSVAPIPCDRRTAWPNLPPPHLLPHPQDEGGCNLSLGGYRDTRVEIVHNHEVSA